MFDVWLGDIELTTLTIIISIVLIFPIQMFLCFKVKSFIIRIIPVGILTFAILVFLFLASTIKGWDSLGYIFLAIFAGIMLFACVLAWALWIIKKLKK